MHNKRFTDEQAVAIRHEYIVNPYATFRSLANIYGCSTSTISDIITYKTYANAMTKGIRAAIEYLQARRGNINDK